MDQIRSYRSLLSTIANELLDNVELAAKLPYGYYFALELLQLSQFVSGLATQHLDSLTGAISARQIEYNNSIEEGIKLQEEMEALQEKWEKVLESAEEASPNLSRP
jgi:hypothetical protein